MGGNTPLEPGQDDDDLDSIIKQSHAKLAEISDSASQSHHGRAPVMNATAGNLPASRGGHRGRPDTQMVRTQEDDRRVDYDRRRNLNNSSVERDGGLVDPSRTAQHFGKAKGSAFAVMGNSALAGQDLAGLPKSGGGKRRNLQHTIDAEEDQAASVGDTVSAGGTRYIVGLKGGLKFYGQNSNSQIDLAESLS